MKKTTLIFLMLTILAAWINSCTKASEDVLQGSTSMACDTMNVKYSTDIVAILTNNCYSCHGANSNGGSGGIILEGYAALNKWAANGYLVGNVTHAPGYVPMPYGLPMLPSCEVNTIVAWVNQGALDN